MAPPLPRRVPRRPAGRRRGRGLPRRRARERGADRLRRRRGARRALRLFLRALRRLDDDLPWEATVVSARGPSSSTPLRADAARARALRRAAEHDEVGDRRRRRRAPPTARCPRPGSSCARWPPARCRSAARSRSTRSCWPRASAACCSPPASRRRSPHRLDRLVRDADLRARLAGAAAPLRAELRWERVADEYEEAYERLVARRHPREGNPDAARRDPPAASASTSTCTCTPTTRGDCATPVERAARHRAAPRASARSR